MQRTPWRCVGEYSNVVCVFYYLLWRWVVASFFDFAVLMILQTQQRPSSGGPSNVILNCDCAFRMVYSWKNRQSRGCRIRPETTLLV